MDNTVNISSHGPFAAIISSNILELYVQKDSDLVELLKNSNTSNIHYPRSYVPANVIKRSVQVRIDRYISIGHESEPVMKSAKQLVALCKKNNHAQLCSVTFNYTKHHYSMWCGKVESRVHVICAIQGGQIPDYAFELPQT